MLENADGIKYLSRDKEWIELSKKEIEQLQMLCKDAVEIQNYSGGCPFELKIVIESGGKQYQVAYAMDGCGLLIIEDTTYEVNVANREMIKEIFGKDFVALVDDDEYSRAEDGAYICWENNYRYKIVSRWDIA
ncbi:hypothetical protein SAMN02910358_02367 [Lachnospiraceae bacterium XBB1006]|nr:hypothetical protein SAMN02910358_02367 [Lachnospiraceae bacterium XBB1006]